MRYEAIEFHDEAAAEAAIARGEPAELLYVPVAASLHAERLEWAQAVCARLAAHPHFNVRGNAVLGFGHLARRFGRLDRAVEPLVRRALADPTRTCACPRTPPPRTSSSSSGGTSRLRSNEALQLGR